MTITFSFGEEPPVDMLAQVEQLYQHTAEELIRAVNAIKTGQFEKATVAAQSVRDLKAAYYWVMEERGKVDKLRKQAAGVLGTGELDLHAARDEIGRRLARLRDVAGS
jgi:hypothetical protein